MMHEMNESRPKPPPGWYPDPSGKPGQMYWDGQQWRTEASPSAAAPTPWDGTRSHSNKGRNFWSGLSRNGKIMLAAGAALVVVIAVVVLVGVIGTGSGGPAGHSPGYQDGFSQGKTLAHSDGTQGSDDASYWCNLASPVTNGHQYMLDWVQGCIAGFSKERS